MQLFRHYKAIKDELLQKDCLFSMKDQAKILAGHELNLYFLACFKGALALLVEHNTGSVGVRSSSLLSSILYVKDLGHSGCLESLFFK